ncbi:DNA translocase FtsK, partial [Bacillus cereus group sp. BceL291]|uniref:DNA translocase FtsK n=1 Tax=Bacillus cereus group sp. BceL291 TaxID=3444993 RepID=UPI003F277337
RCGAGEKVEITSKLYLSRPVRVSSYPSPLGLGCYTFVRPFKEFPAQSRKYKVILTIASQTLSQLALDFTEQYMFTLLGSFRNKMIFGDVTPYDAKIFSDMFGETEEFKESESEQGISPMQENPVSRLGSTYQKLKEVVMSPGDIMAQGAFICAARIVQDNHVQPVQQITSNFVPKEEFAQAIIQVEIKSGQYWENERLRLIEESIAKSNPMKHVDANNIKQIESFPPRHGDKIGQNNSIETNNKNQHIVELENYKEHKSEYETNTVENVTFSDYSTAVSQQVHVIEETENKLYEEIKAFVIESQQISPSLLQRKFRISHIKAVQFIEKLEHNQVVSTYTGNGPRKVLISNNNSTSILSKDSQINTTPSSNTDLDNTTSRENSIPNEETEAQQEETGFFKDILYDDVVAFVKESGNASIHALQNAFKIDYTRASRLQDALQRNGELPGITKETHMEIVSPKKNMELAERKKEVSNTMLEPKRDIDYPIHLGFPVETDPLQKKLLTEGLITTVLEEAKTDMKTNLKPATKTVNPTKENKLDEEVAKVYESISITVHQNLEKNLVENTRNNEEQHEDKHMNYKERQKGLKAKQKNTYNNTNSLLNKNQQQKKNTSNVMSKELDDFFD